MPFWQENSILPILGSARISEITAVSKFNPSRACDEMKPQEAVWYRQWRTKAGLQSKLPGCRRLYFV
jgi:hypothetical protein